MGSTQERGTAKGSRCVVETSDKSQQPLVSQGLTGQVSGVVAALPSAAPTGSPTAAKERFLKVAEAAKPVPANSNPFSAPAENKENVGPRNQRKALVTICNKLTFETIYRRYLTARREFAEVLEQNAILLQQISKQQQEITGLKKSISKTNTTYIAQYEKYQPADVDLGSSKSTIISDKQEAEAKITGVIPKDDGATASTMMADEEKNSINARFRGQEDRIAELEGQIAVMKQAEQRREAKFEEMNYQNEVLRAQNKVLTGKIVNWKSQLTGLNRNIARMSTANTQLRTAVIAQVLATPAPNIKLLPAQPPEAKGQGDLIDP